MSDFYDNIKKGVIAGIFACGTMAGLHFGLRIFVTAYYQWFRFLKTRLRNRHNALTVVHRNRLVFPNRYDLLAEEEFPESHIQIATQLKFLEQYEKLDKDRDINLIIETVGGAMSSSEAICNYILNHKGKGKIRCFIPRYAHSGGCMIALTCDEIIMTPNSIISPCDAQHCMGLFARPHSNSAIMYTAKYKKERSEKIDETWLASEHDALLCSERQQKFMDKLVDRGKYDKETGKVIFEEFFSGKYNHDHLFSAEDAQRLGLNVQITDRVPEWVRKFLD